MNLANHLSLLRILLVPLFVAALIYYSPGTPYFYPIAVGIFLFACLTDAVDGYIARRFNQRTVLGSYIDPIADKLLLLSGFFSLSFMTNLPAATHIPAWVTITVISRDTVILIGSLVIFLATGSLTARPLPIGKITTVLQMMTLVAALLSAPDPLRFALFVFTVLLTFISGIRYIQMGGQLLK